MKKLVLDYLLGSNKETEKVFSLKRKFSSIFCFLFQLAMLPDQRSSDQLSKNPQSTEELQLFP